eukprot:5220871-Pyramimonas_sp.AAC.1
MPDDPKSRGAALNACSAAPPPALAFHTRTPHAHKGGQPFFLKIWRKKRGSLPGYFSDGTKSATPVAPERRMSFANWGPLAPDTRSATFALRRLSAGSARPS